MTCANTNLPSLIGPSRGLQTGRQDGPGRKSGRGRYRHHGEMTLPQYLSSTYCENAIQRWDTTDPSFMLNIGPFDVLGAPKAIATQAGATLPSRAAAPSGIRGGNVRRAKAGALQIQFLRGALARCRHS